jgi:hypothetical protein
MPTFVYHPCRLLGALVLCLLGFSSTARGQAAWEFEPYQVQIWLALPDDPTWQEVQLEQFRSILIGRAETTFGSVWNCEVQTVPPALASDVRYRLADLTAEQVAAALPEQITADKIYLVEVQDDQGLLRVQVRELDYRARQIGILLERETPQREALPWVIWDAIAQAFTPLVRIERVENSNIAARLRAGGLITSEQSPAWVRKDAVLRPVIRRNDRAGEPVKGGISLVPWTMIEVEEQTGSVLKCKLHSGYRQPIPVKATARLERLALLVRPEFPSTVLHLRSRDVTRSPLGGYEIWRKTSETDGDLLGSTDWQGNIELPRAETGVLQTLLVRSGGQLLAKLPLVPGQEPRLNASVPNDDGRLQAEGFVVALQSKIMDLEARRQIASMRIRKQIKDGKLAEAQQILEEMRNFETRADLNRLIDQQRLRSSDAATQKRIDKLISDARILLSKFLDPELPNILQREIAIAKTAPPPAAGAKTAGKNAAPPSATKTPATTPPATPPAGTQPAATPPAGDKSATPMAPAKSATPNPFGD